MSLQTSPSSLASFRRAPPSPTPPSSGRSATTLADVGRDRGACSLVHPQEVSGQEVKDEAGSAMSSEHLVPSACCVHI